jgi:biopolymer transport protein ExbD
VWRRITKHAETLRHRATGYPGSTQHGIRRGVQHNRAATSFKQPSNPKKKAELPISLPVSQASLEPDEAGTAPLVIGIDKRGQLFLDGAPVSTQILHGRLKNEAAADPGRRVRIDGDQLATYQDIVHVLDLCQFERLTNISMYTRGAR